LGDYGPRCKNEARDCEGGCDEPKRAPRGSSQSRWRARPGPSLLLSPHARPLHPCSVLPRPRRGRTVQISEFIAMFRSGGGQDHPDFAGHLTSPTIERAARGTGNDCIKRGVSNAAELGTFRPLRLANPFGRFVSRLGLCNTMLGASLGHCVNAGAKSLPCVGEHFNLVC
jgi:hypothetical protein